MKSTRGYMLLEVVLALSIFIVAVVGLLKSLSAGLDANYRQQMHTNTRLNLQSLLDEALALPPESRLEKFAPDVFHVSYQREIKPEAVKLSDGKELKDIFKVTVTAMDTKRDNKVISELWTYVSP